MWATVLGTVLGTHPLEAFCEWWGPLASYQVYRNTSARSVGSTAWPWCSHKMVDRGCFVVVYASVSGE